MAKKPGTKKEATGRAVFNTNNDAEFAKQVGANVGTNNQATGTTKKATFNSNNK